MVEMSMLWKKGLFPFFILLSLFLPVYSQSIGTPPTSPTTYEELLRNTTIGLVPAGCPPTFGSSSGFYLFDFYSASLIAIIASFLIALIFYFFARILAHPQAYSIISIKVSDLVFLVLIFLATTIILQVFYSSPTDLGSQYFEKAVEYNLKVINRILYTSVGVFIVNTMLYAVYNYQIPVPLGVNNLFGFYLGIGPAFKPLIDISTTLGNFIGIIFSEFYTRYVALCFIKSYLIPMFFPLGLFLRAFNATRGAGSALIGISLAIYIVYPVMVTLNYALYEVHFGVSQSLDLTATAGIKMLLDMLGGAGGLLGLALVLTFIFKFVAAASLPLLTPVSAYLLKSVFFIFLVILTLFFLSKFMALLMELIHLMVVFGFILPALNIFVTLNVAREISKALGAEIDLSSLMKLI